MTDEIRHSLAETVSHASAASRRFSPDMKLRWLPVIDGKVVVGRAIPFSGFATKAEAINAAKQLNTSHQPEGER
jgi:hypothetical protein